jgi:hypothetical protein
MKTTFFVFALASTLVISCGNGSTSHDYSSPTEEKNAGASSQNDATESEAPAAPAYEESTVMDVSKERDMDIGQRNGNVNNLVVSSLAAAEYTNDTLRKFIKTGNMSFQVAQLEKATYHIEDIIFRNGGFITSTELHSDITSTERVRVSEDSVLEITRFTLRNDMQFRVPAKQLDSTLRQIGRFAKYLDYRNIYAEDVSIDLYAEYLKRIREKKHNERLGKAVSEKGNKLESITDAEQALLQSDERKDESTIATMKKMDAISYATFTIHFYENDRVTEHVVPYETSPKKYEPGFWSKMGDSFSKGWNMFLEFLVALTEGWFIILLLAILGTWVYRKFFRA